MSANVTVFTRAGCDQCGLLKEYLDRRGVTYAERDVARDPEALAELRRINAPGLPVAVIDGDAVLGFDKPRLDDLLKSKGVSIGEPA